MAAPPSVTAPPVRIPEFRSTPARAQVDQLVQAAVGEGQRAAAALARAPWLDTKALRQEGLKVAGSPPDAAVAARELELVREASGSRTAADTRAAGFFNARGDQRVWKQYLAEFRRTATADQVARGEQLLREASRSTDAVAERLKDSFQRPRPYVVDASLPAIRGNTAGDRSFVSSHASSAFAQATVLGTLMPERRAELLETAGKVAWSRVISAVHFPSDVAAGARLGTFVASYVAARDAAAGAATATPARAAA